MFFSSMGPRWTPKHLLDQFWEGLGRIWGGFGEGFGIHFGQVIELVGNAIDYPKLFQLYIRGNQQWVFDQISKAIDNGFIALCLTVDLDAYGLSDHKFEG